MEFNREDLVFRFFLSSVVLIFALADFCFGQDQGGSDFCLRFCTSSTDPCPDRCTSRTRGEKRHCNVPVRGVPFWDNEKKNLILPIDFKDGGNSQYFLHTQGTDDDGGHSGGGLEDMCCVVDEVVRCGGLRCSEDGNSIEISRCAVIDGEATCINQPASSCCPIDGYCGGEAMGCSGDWPHPHSNSSPCGLEVSCAPYDGPVGGCIICTLSFAHDQGRCCSGSGENVACEGAVCCGNPFPPNFAPCITCNVTGSSSSSGGSSSSSSSSRGNSSSESSSGGSSTSRSSSSSFSSSSSSSSSSTTSFSSSSSSSSSQEHSTSSSLSSSRRSSSVSSSSSSVSSSHSSSSRSSSSHSGSNSGGNSSSGGSSGGSSSEELFLRD